MIAKSIRAIPYTDSELTAADHVLSAAADILSGPDAWLQHYSHADAAGRPVFGYLRGAGRVAKYSLTAALLAAAADVAHRECAAAAIDRRPVAISHTAADYAGAAGVAVRYAIWPDNAPDWPEPLETWNDAPERVYADIAGAIARARCIIDTELYDRPRPAALELPICRCAGLERPESAFGPQRQHSGNMGISNRPQPAPFAPYAAA